MKNLLFSRNTDTTGQATASKPFLLRHCEEFTLAAIAITFGLALPLTGLFVVIAGQLLLFVWPSSITGFGYGAAAIWGLFAAWLWVSLVIIAKKDRHLRTSDAELLTLQVLCFGLTFGHWLFASPSDRAILTQIALVFDMCVLALYILYFLLALCVWVRLPLRPYLAFAVLLAVTAFQLLY